MCRCEVIKGQVGQQELRSGKAGAVDDQLGNHATASETDHPDTDMNSERRTEVLVVLQPIPQDCARLRLDPRIINLKPPISGTVAYEIGIWPAWSDTTLDDHLLNIADNQSERSGDLCHQVVFASRYLIADSSASL